MMRRTVPLALLTSLAAMVYLGAGTAPVSAQDASAVDVCLRVEAPAGVDLSDPAVVAAAISSGTIDVIDVIDCVDPVGEPAASPADSGWKGNRFGTWFVSDITGDGNTDGTTAISVVEASSGSFGSGGPAILAVRCNDGEVDLHITWHEVLPDEFPVVETQSESLALEALPWNRSTDQLSTFYPGHLVRPFIESLYGESTLAAGTTPTGRRPLTAVFTIDGIEDALVNVHKACGW